MTMLRAGFTVAMIIFGLASALLGGVVLFSALRTGSITVSYGSGADAVKQVLTYAGERTRFLQFAGLLGLMPFLIGLVLARMGFRAIRRS
ncbi:MAG: hypothetical protein AB7S74_01520 [Hyphomicrobium sp.]